MTNIAIHCFSDVRDSLIDYFSKQSVIPILGAGLTMHCNAREGVVPSGKEYRDYMISAILSNGIPISPAEEQILRNESFSVVATTYNQLVAREKQLSYLRKNFTNVIVNKNKQRFLSINWPYIYTLNIDDCIENNSPFNYVVFANRTVNPEVFNNNKCVIKLHGDIHDILKYTDSNSMIFNQKQYASSILSNSFLLNKLKHDFIYKNLLYIGCSLDDEIDLLAEIGSNNEMNSTSRYYCTIEAPSVLQRIKLSNYGITDCIIFDSYDEIYTNIYHAYLESKKLHVDSLAEYNHYSSKKIIEDYEQNKPYLFFGKNIIDKNHVISFPYFFISREIIRDILDNIARVPIQMIIGNSCSGKTYVAIDLLNRIKDKKVFFFESKTQLSDTAFEKLISEKNVVIITDEKALSVSQINHLLIDAEKIRRNNSAVVFFANRNDRDIAGLIQLLHLQGKIEDTSIRSMELTNRFNTRETIEINNRLAIISSGVFKENKSIIDNIIFTSKQLLTKNKFASLEPKTDTIQEIACLIALATKKKIYTTQAVMFDLVDEFNLQVKSAVPLIDREFVWMFENNPYNNSPLKYVINADNWLYHKLDKYARDPKNHKSIVDAYFYLVYKILETYGKPDINKNNRNNEYKEYIIFDNINRIFYSQGKEGIVLIQKIYKQLNTLLATDPSYLHQRAKCNIKSAALFSDQKEKMQLLNDAFRDVTESIQLFSYKYEKTSNEKVLISMSHAEYTKALILCHQCDLIRYKDINMNTEAIQQLYHSLLSPYNTYEYSKTDSYNYGNVIDNLLNGITMNTIQIQGCAKQIFSELFALTMK